MDSTATVSEQPVKASAQPEATSATPESKPVVTEPKSETTPTPVKTFTQEEFEAEVAKREAHFQSVKDKELQPLKSQIEELTKKSTEFQLTAQEEKERTSQGDSESLRQIQLERRNTWNMRLQHEREKQEFEVIRRQVAEDAKKIRAHNLVKDLSLDEKSLKQLLDAENPEKMELLAFKMRSDKLSAELEELKKTPQKIDSGTPSAKLSSKKAIEDAFINGELGVVEYKRLMQKEGVKL